MWVSIWTSDITCAYVGSSPLSAIYVWDTKVRPMWYNIEFLLVGWGWAGGMGSSNTSVCSAWWWWAGWVVYCASYALSGTANIRIGKWNTYCGSWGYSCLEDIYAYWWWGACCWSGDWCCWASGWWWWPNKLWGCAICDWIQWHCWWNWWASACWWGWGWGWYCEAWKSTYNWCISCWGLGWMWYSSSISGTEVYYWSGWSWWSSRCMWNIPAVCGWWCWGCGRAWCNTNWWDATTPWSWWGWVWCRGYYGGWWKDGIFIARYETACWYKIFWGCRYICGDYTIHCFESDGCLIIDPTTPTLQYLVVGGWGGWYYSWWWGGAVCLWVIENACSSYSITIWTWWAACCDWSASCIWDVVVANWWCAGTLISCGVWWASWGGCCWWGWFCGACCWKGWWNWLYWYWGWWGGWWKCSDVSANISVDGGGKWTCCTSACTVPTNCGWGWGWAIVSWWSGWANWLVEICYPADWSWNIHCATWGTVTLKDWMCVHRFTSNGTFTIVS